MLCATELWERYSYYAMRALLILFMKDVLLARGRWTEVFGMQTLAAVYGGPDDDADDATRDKQVLALASRVYGLYTAFVYFTPLFGVRRTGVNGGGEWREGKGGLTHHIHHPRRICYTIVHAPHFQVLNSFSAASVPFTTLSGGLITVHYERMNQQKSIKKRYTAQTRQPSNPPRPSPLPYFEGYLADGYFGTHAMIVAGAVLMGCGHGFLALHPAFLLGMTLIALGNGQGAVCSRVTVTHLLGREASLRCSTPFALVV